jgi:hypothetical protein
MSLFLMVVGGGSGLDADEEIDEGLLLLHEGLDEFFLMGWERCDEGEGTLLVGSGDQLVLVEGMDSVCWRSYSASRLTLLVKRWISETRLAT